MMGTTVSHIEKCHPKNAEEEKDMRIRAVVSLILHLELSKQRTHLAVRPYIRHRGKRRRAGNGMQG